MGYGEEETILNLGGNKMNKSSPAHSNHFNMLIYIFYGKKRRTMCFQAGIVQRLYNYNRGDKTIPLSKSRGDKISITTSLFLIKIPNQKSCYYYYYCCACSSSCFLTSFTCCYCCSYLFNCALCVYSDIV